MMPGEGAVRNGSTKLPCGRIEHASKILAFGVDRRRIEIAHLADRLGRQEIADRVAAGLLLLQHLLEDRVARDVAARPALPAAAKAAHAVLDVEEEAFALLLAVVADVDAGLDLLRHDLAQRVAAGGVECGGVDRLAAARLRIELDQLGGRGRLPAWVVRIRSSLQRIAASR